MTNLPSNNLRPYDKFINYENFPHMWCPGCGNGLVLKAISQGLTELGLDIEDVILCNGIGCSGRLGEYVRCHRFQGTHGRALAFATGLTLSQPNKKVIVVMGDGDGGVIGGNHLIHCARRNLDITAIVINNFNYGMTGGQYSATTPHNSKTTTSKDGKAEAAIDLCELVQVAGANYVARSTVTQYNNLVKTLKKGLEKSGFSFLEILSMCPTHFGKNNLMAEPLDLYHWLENSKLRMGILWEDEGEENNE
jgi:2-oxoglutarate/2-oxoacid ferredoxin oxidoreductase subunit beta